MKGNSVKYLIKEGFRNIRANRLMSLASVGVLTACLILVGFTILLTQNIDHMVGFVERQNEVVVFLKMDATQDKIDDMKKDFENEENVEKVTYISKEQALSDYMDSLSDKTLAENIGDELFLPASLRISIKDLNGMNQIVEKAEEYDIYDSSNAPTGAAETINSMKNTLAVISMAVIFALIIVSLVVISNTIRATVFTRRAEIGIMKQVGATNNFIRIPFLAEGIILGLISALVAFVIVGGAYGAISSLLMKETSSFLRSMYENVLPFATVGWILALSFLFSGVAAGALGSVLSLRKHLNV